MNISKNAGISAQSKREEEKKCEKERKTAKRIETRRGAAKKYLPANCSRRQRGEIKCHETRDAVCAVHVSGDVVARQRGILGNVYYAFLQEFVSGQQTFFFGGPREPAQM